ncbi:MAG TPA: DUF4173 domain-containing protein [Solirubrobacteraceae bacterium]
MRRGLAFAAAGLLGAATVIGAPVGLGVCVALVAVLAAGKVGAGRPPHPLFGALALGLATMAVVRDAGWVVAVDVVAALAAGALALRHTSVWTALRLPQGLGVAGAALRTMLPERRPGALGPVLRGTALAVVLVATFGGLFASADGAFAELAGDTLPAQLDAGDLTLRALVGLLALAVAGALALPVAPSGAPVEPRWRLGRAEWQIPLVALDLLFAAFVAVQFAVLFGGERHVLETAGLGYGEYARHGFVELLVVAALTLGVIGLSARRAIGDPRLLRLLLGVLIALTGVVLASAVRRLELVEEAYGFTNVRFAGHAIVLWLAAVFALVAASGLSAAVARRARTIAAAGTLAFVLGVSLLNPEGWVARENVERHARTGKLDEYYASKLSADAVPALARLPRGDACRVIGQLQAPRLERPDGVLGANRARARARRAVDDLAC